MTLPHRSISLSTAVSLAAMTGVMAPGAFGQTFVQLDTTGHRIIGDTAELDRTRFFAHHGHFTPGAFATDLMLSETGLNSNPTRETFELDFFLARNLPEDPTRPGFGDPTELRARVNNSLNPFIATNERWRQVREAENPLYIFSGRATANWPAYMRTIPAGEPNAGYTHPDMIMNPAAYAEFLTIFLEEVELPGSLAPDRMAIELMNEPNAVARFGSGQNFDLQDVIDLHSEVITTVKQSFPDQIMGGPSSCCYDLGDDDMDMWFNEIKPYIEQVPNSDFISVHPYDRYSVKPDGSVVRDFSKGPGHMAASMDLVEAHSTNTLGAPMPFAFTEYGSWNRTEMADGSYGSYTKELQQWDLTRDVREKLFVFMDRPDRVYAATPFIFARDWRNETPTSLEGDNVYWERDAAGVWSETIVAKMARMYAPVSGRYIPVTSFDSDLQVQAFRDGDQIYLMLNNLRTTDQSVNLLTLLGEQSLVTAAQIDRIQMVNGVPTHIDDQDLSNAWQNLTLTGEEGAVLTLTVSGPQIYDRALATDTYYSSVTAETLDAAGSSSTFQIDADLEDATAVTARVGFIRPAGAADGEALQVFINGNGLLIPSGELAIDDGDYSSFVSREINIPLSMLVDGVNDVRVDFAGTGGRMTSTVFEVTRTIGEYNGDFNFGPEDIDALFAAFGTTEVDGRFDLAGSDGVVDDQDVAHWLNILRGTELGDANLDGVIGLLDLDILGANWQAEGTGWGGGDFNGDGVVSLLDLDILGAHWGFGAAFDTLSFEAALAATGVPAPAVALPMMVALPFLRRRRAA